MPRLRHALALALAAVLALPACGGGGSGGDGGGSGSGLSLSPTALTLSADQGAPVPPLGAIQVTITDPAAAYIVAGFPAGASVPGWLDLSLSGAGASWTCTVAAKTTMLPAGSYSATVRILIARADQSVIGYRDALVTYTLAPALTASPGTLAFDGFQGGAPPAARSVSVGGSSGMAWTATPSEGWIVLGQASGTTPATVSVSVDPTGLATGTHLGSITFSGAGKTAQVTVSLALAAPGLQTSQATLAFSGVNGAPLAAQPLGLSMNSGAAVPWTATAADGWVVLDRTSGTTPDTISVRVDPAIGPLASGSRSSTVDVTASAGGATWHASVRVDLSLAPAILSLAPAALVIGGADGRDPSAKTVQLGLDTGPSAFGWTASPDAAWMDVSSASTTTSGTPVTVAVAPVSTGLRGGTRQGSILFAASVNGDVVAASLPVTYNLDAHRLLVSDDGVALSTVPGSSRLTRTVRVRDSLGAGAPWSATSDQPWLAVTPGGTADGDLVLTADPTGLATDAAYEASVAVSSADESVENVETIRVGLWVGGAAPGRQTVSLALQEVVADPVRPLAYVHGGGGAVSIYNVYTGASVGSIAGLPASLGGMAIASDGSTLWVADRAGAQVVPVRLADRAVGAPWPLATSTNAYPRLGYARTDGLPLLVVTDGAVHRARDGATLATFISPASATSDLLVATSRDGHAFCSAGCRALRYSVLGGGTVTLAALAGSGGSRDVALVADGSRVLGASGAPYYCQGWDTASGTQVMQLGTSLPYPGNVEVGSDGKLYCGLYSTYGDDLWVFDGAGAQLGSLRMAGYSQSLLDREVAISGDGRRIVGLTSDPSLTFVTAP